LKRTVKVGGAWVDWPKRLMMYPAGTLFWELSDPQVPASRASRGGLLPGLEDGGRGVPDLMGPSGETGLPRFLFNASSPVARSLSPRRRLLQGPTWESHHVPSLPLQSLINTNLHLHRRLCRIDSKARHPSTSQIWTRCICKATKGVGRYLTSRLQIHACGTPGKPGTYRYRCER
jgi:hypothetical protein